MIRGVVHSEIGRSDEARAALGRLRALGEETYVWPAYVAYVAMRLGLIDETFASLDRMFDERAVGVIGLGREAIYDPIRGDARFSALLRRAGLPSS